MLLTGQNMSLQLNITDREFLITKQTYSWRDLPAAVLPITNGIHFFLPELDYVFDIKPKFAADAAIRILDTLEDKPGTRGIFEIIPELLTPTFETETPKKLVLQKIAFEGLIHLNRYQPDKMLKQIDSARSRTFDLWGDNRDHVNKSIVVALQDASQHTDSFTYEQLELLIQHTELLSTNNIGARELAQYIEQNRNVIRHRFETAIILLKRSQVMTMEMDDANVSDMEKGIRYNVVIPANEFWG